MFNQKLRSSKEVSPAQKKRPETKDGQMKKRDPGFPARGNENSNIE